MKLLTIEEAAEYIRQSVGFVRERTRERCAESKRIPCVKLSRKSILFRDCDLDDWINKHLITPRQTPSQGRAASV